MREKVMLILGCIVLTGLGCSTRPKTAQSEQAQDHFRVIVHIETRNEITTVMSGRQGCLYTVKTKDDTTLEEQLSEHELWTKFPAIYRLLKTSYASQSNAAWAGGNL